MKTVRMTRRLGLLAALLGATALAGTAHAADPVKLKLSSFEPPMANITANVLAPFAKEAAAASGGTLRRNPTQQLKLVTDGIADIAWVVLPYTPGRFDDTDVVGLPFVSRNATEASAALHRLYASGVLVGFEGLKMLAVGATPPVVIHATQPVRLPSDLKNKRVRASGQQLTNIIEAVGGAPVAMGGGQIAE